MCPAISGKHLVALTNSVIACCLGRQGLVLFWLGLGPSWALFESVSSLGLRMSWTSFESLSGLGLAFLEAGSSLASLSLQGLSEGSNFSFLVVHRYRQFE